MFTELKSFAYDGSDTQRYHAKSKDCEPKLVHWLGYLWRNIWHTFRRQHHWRFRNGMCDFGLTFSRTIVATSSCFLFLCLISPLHFQQISPGNNSMGYKVQESSKLSRTDGKYHDPAHWNGKARSKLLDVPDGSRIGIFDSVVLRRKTCAPSVWKTTLSKRYLWGYLGGICGRGRIYPGLPRRLPRWSFTEEHYGIGRKRELDLW